MRGGSWKVLSGMGYVIAAHHLISSSPVVVSQNATVTALSVSPRVIHPAVADNMG
ncbi:MAG: hypothetical protein AABZ11_00870 [Nitrospinota bacterium]